MIYCPHTRNGKTNPALPAFDIEYQQDIEFKRIKNDNQAEKLFPFCLFYPLLLYIFALVLR